MTLTQQQIDEIKAALANAAVSHGSFERSEPAEPEPAPESVKPAARSRRDGPKKKKAEPGSPAPAPLTSLVAPSPFHQAAQPLNLSELKTAYELMMRPLKECTGLPDRSREIVTCWTLATHALPSCKIFPILTLRGVMGSGKSATLSVIENFARSPRRLSLDGSTLPVIRDAMADARLGTLIVEEGDSAWNDRDHSAEKLFNSRYNRETELSSLKVQLGSQVAFRSENRKLFGASVVHKRQAWHDPVMDGKSIEIIFRFNASRDTDSYRDFDFTDPWNKEGKEILTGKSLDLPALKHPKRVASRVWNTWRPIAQIARLLDISALEENLTRVMYGETSKLGQAQGEEPTNLVLNAIMGRIFGGLVPDWGQIDVALICRDLENEHHLQVSSYRLSNYAKEMGLMACRSGGRSRIRPTPNDLLRAADYCSLHDDEQIEALRQTMAGQPSYDPDSARRIIDGEL